MTTPSDNSAYRTAEQKEPLHISVQAAIERYFSQIGDTPITNLYSMVLAEVEVPVLKTVLQQVRLNQSKAATILGISRGTLRKKIKIYHLERWIKQQQE